MSTIIVNLENENQSIQVFRFCRAKEHVDTVGMQVTIRNGIHAPAYFTMTQHTWEEIKQTIDNSFKEFPRKGT